MQTRSEMISLTQKYEKDEDKSDIVDIDYQIEEAEKTHSNSANIKQNNEKSPNVASNSKNEVLDEVKELYKKIEEKEKEYEILHNKYLRALADYENLEKRNRKEFSRITKQGNRQLLIKLIDLADSFEKANTNMTTENEIEKIVIADGFQAVYSHFKTILKNEGVTRIDAIGKQFDPNFHEAVYTKKDNNIDEDTIIEEVQAGYILNDELLRPTKVVIAKKDEGE